MLSALLGLACIPSPSTAAQEAQRAILQLTVNDVDKGEVFVLLRDGEVR